MISLILGICIFFSVGVLSPRALNTESIIYYGFESEGEGWDYWSVSGAKATYPVSEASSEGEKSLFLYDTSKFETAGIKSGYFSVSGGETYTLLVSAFVIKSKVTMYLRCYDSDNIQLVDNNVTFTGKYWEEKAVSYTFPDDAVKAQVIICTTGTDIAGIYLDGVSLIHGSAGARGVISGKVPAELPVIEETYSEIPVVDDGYEEGELFYFRSFEEGIGDWVTYVDSSSYKVVEENATHGSHSLYIKDSSASMSAGAKSQPIYGAQGNIYTIYVDTYIRTTGIALYARFYDKENKQVGQQGLGFPALGWSTGRLSVTAPENTSSFVIFFAGNVAGFGEAYFDNIKIYKGNIIKRPDEFTYISPVQSAPVSSHIIEPVNNRLYYNSYNEMGDTLSDFSYAGYYGGKIELPVTEKLPLFETLSPSGTEDDTAMVQAAIDRAYAKHKGEGMQVIRLKAGKYNINKNGIKLKSGILLSGEGQGPTGTVLYAGDAVDYNVIQIIGDSPVKKTSDIKITDEYVKSGSRIITVENTSQLSEGDRIVIVHPSTAEWIEAMRMKDVQTVYGDKLSWHENEINTKTERIITEINGNEITLDYGVFIPYERAYAESYIYKIDDSGRIHDAGVENVRVQSYFNGDPLDLNHARMAIYTQKSKNIFIRNVTAKNMFNGVFGCRNYATGITVLNCTNIDPVSTVVGGNRYPFYADVDTESILFSGCYSFDGRHDYMAVKGTSGPVVFTDCIADSSNACSETHAGFATGVLFDNLYQITDRSKGYFGFPNRGYYGTTSTQGWSAAGCVAWNCLANSIIVHKPPLSYQNFSVGVWGIYNGNTSAEIKKQQSDSYRYAGYGDSDHTEGPETAFATEEGTPFVGDAYKESAFAPVNPRSIFKAQLAARFTDNYLNAKPNAPVIVYPRPDKEVEENTITVSGFYEKGAQAVNIYADDIKYEADLNETDNSFSVSLNLTEGIHKIYATQVINKVEGNKTSDRFITVGEGSSENFPFLESNYDREKTAFILCDPRLTYDEYLKSNEGKLSSADIESITVTKYDSSFKTVTQDIKPLLTDGIIESNDSLISYYNASKVKSNGLSATENANQHWLLALDKVYDLTSITLSYSHSHKWVDFRVRVSENGKDWKDLGIIRPAQAAVKDEPVTIPLNRAKGRFIRLSVEQRNGTNAASTDATVWGANKGAGCSIALFEINSVMGIPDYSHSCFIEGYEKAFTLYEPFFANNMIVKSPSAIVFAKAVESYGEYKRCEYGFLLSEKKLAKNEFLTDSDVLRIEGNGISESDYYGIRFYGKGIKGGSEYFGLPYAKYIDFSGEELEVYGEDILSFIPEEK